ncbi:MAG: glycosyltransferase family 2 protein [Clostridium sp.]
MKCSIVIAVYNEENYIKDCIESLMNQDFNRDEYEVSVYDGRSTDNTMVILKELELKYSNLNVRENKKKYQAFAFNLGIREAKGEYVSILGAHAYYPTDFISKSVERLDKEQGIDCVGGKIIMTGRNNISRAYGAVRNTIIGGGLSPYRFATKTQLVDTVAFGCYRKSILKRVDGFNEELIKNQDNDLNKRIVAIGGKIMLDPSIEFYYYCRDTIKGIIKQMYNYGFWESVLVKANSDQFSIQLIIPPLFVLGIFGGIVISMLGIYLPLLVCIIAYTLLTTYFSVKVREKSRNILLSILMYFLIHISIGVGLIVGFIKKT